MSACECATNIYICDNVDIRTHWMCVTLPLIAVFVNFTHSRIPWREPQKSKHVQNRKKTTGIHSTIYVHNKIDCWLISSFPFMRFLSPFLRCTGFELLTLIFRQYKEYTICLPSAPAHRFGSNFFVWCLSRFCIHWKKNDRCGYWNEFKRIKYHNNKFDRSGVLITQTQTAHTYTRWTTSDIE